MNEDEKMLHISVGFFAAILLLTATLQVCYRTQGRMLNQLRKDIVDTQQEIAVAQANFASYVRPEILRNVVTSIAPKSELISYQKAVSIDELPNRAAQQ